MTPNFIVTFDLSVSTPVFRLEDITDYSSVATPNTILGLYKIEGPAGIPVYNNTNWLAPDVDIAIGPNFNTVQIPKDVNGDIVYGEYEFTYEVSITVGSETDIYTFSKTVELKCIKAEAKIEVDVDCLCGKYTSRDATSYTGGTIVSREHKVYYPAALDIAPVVSSADSIILTDLYTHSWSSKIESFVSYDLGNGDSTLIKISGTVEKFVNCDSLCDISCCVEGLEKKYKSLQTISPVEAERSLKKLIRIAVLKSHIQDAVACGRPKDVDVYIKEILDLGECVKGCGCGSDAPQKVVPICGGSASGGGNGNTYVVDVVQGSGLSVSTNVNGSETTFTLNVTGAFFTTATNNVITNLLNGKLTAGSGIKINNTGTPNNPILNIASVTGETWKVVNASAVNVAQTTFAAPILSDVILDAGLYLISTSAHLKSNADFPVAKLRETVIEFGVYNDGVQIAGTYRTLNQDIDLDIYDYTYQTTTLVQVLANKQIGLRVNNTRGLETNKRHEIANCSIAYLKIK